MSEPGSFSPAECALVVTSIAAPNAVLRSLAQGCQREGHRFFVVGDAGSPSQFSLAGCTFLSLAQQFETGLRTALLCPQKHYARKNIGYLLAIQSGCQVLVETDDDNFPRAEFWELGSRKQHCAVIQEPGWLNVYSYFSDANVWPRGLPLDSVRGPVPAFEGLSQATLDCPIQQGLADDNPDVDAIYRLVVTSPVRFRTDRRVGLGKGVWCPFNSQNTRWWPDAYPLLYLPAHCSFRMTDIWRSFVAQRIAWENGWSVLFHEPTVWQERNEHNLLRDFEDEVPGYLHNRRIGEVLQKLSLAPGLAQVGANLRLCYEALIRHGIIGEAELPLVDAWLEDLAALRSAR